VVNRRAAIALIVFAVSLTVYLFTLAPTVALIDSGELTDAAWSLGNAHPPGFPLFLVLTHLFTLLPTHSVAWRANLASAFFSAAAAAFTALAAYEILNVPLPPGEGAAERRVRGRKRAKTVVAPPPVALPLFAITLIAIASGLLLAFSKTVWRYAVETEVYALNTALMTAIAFLMFSWMPARHSTTLYIAAFLFGLALGVHHVTIGLGALAIAILITRTAGAAFWRSRNAVVAAMLLCAGLLVYAYIPLAAAHDPAMNWGNPRTAHQVWDHITGKAYRGYLTSGGGSVSAQFDRYFGYLFRELGPPWLPVALLIAVIGLFALWRRQRTLFWYLALLIAGDVAWFLFYPVKHDQDAYEIPSFLALVLAFAFGARRIFEWRPAAAHGVLLVPLLALVVAFPVRNRRQFWVARDYSANALRAMEGNPLLITNDWQMYSPMRYLLDVERVRNDVAIIAPGFLESDWYHDEISKRYAEILRGCENEQRRAREVVARFDDDRGLWQDAAARGDLYDRLDDLVLAIIARQLHRGPVYLTIDTALAWNARDKKLIARLKKEHDIVPHGVVMEVVAGHTFRDIKWTPITTRGLFDGTVRYDDDDPVPNELLPAYRGAFLTRGRYLAISRHYKEAIDDYQQALALDPENSMIVRELSGLQAMRH
jgi:hypothetical protein